MSDIYPRCAYCRKSLKDEPEPFTFFEGHSRIGPRMQRTACSRTHAERYLEGVNYWRSEMNKGSMMSEERKAVATEPNGNVRVLNGPTPQEELSNSLRIGNVTLSHDDRIPLPVSREAWSQSRSYHDCTLKEWIESLPPHHTARQEYAMLMDRLKTLEGGGVPKEVM